ncbi:MAG: hypothetical protein Kow0042_24920 [Calditrichia bacterium]
MEKRVTRKDFLRGFVNLFRETIEGRAVETPEKTDTFVLPPGIQSPDHYLATCSRCYHCVSACPHEALRVQWAETSAYHSYPVIEPRRQPCYRCSDFPCVTACQAGALDITFTEKPLGTAVVKENLCVTYQGAFCQSCVTHCPLSGIAIWKDFEGHPVVNEEVCTGCGMCSFVCVSEPPAIGIKFYGSS